MVVKLSLYDQAVVLSEEYLGPAGERFLRRQIKTHLAITPEKLTSKDLPLLVTWVSLAFALLTDNADDVQSYSSRLLALGA